MAIETIYSAVSIFFLIVENRSLVINPKNPSDVRKLASKKS
jgi:hypothetical protein